MKKSKSVIFIVSSIVIVVIAFYLMWKNNTAQSHKEFGDIRIRTVDEKKEGYQTISLERGGQLIFLAYQTSTGITESMAIYDGKDNQPILTIDKNGPIKDTFALVYGKMDRSFEPVEGPVYFDIDMDGEIDLHGIRNADGKIEKYLAYVDDEWKLVTVFDPKEACIQVEGNENKIPMATSQRTLHTSSNDNGDVLLKDTSDGSSR